MGTYGPELFKLTHKQQLAFNRLKRAYRDCKKLGVVFYNNYGTIGALDRDKFEDSFYDDDEDEDSIADDGDNLGNEIMTDMTSWADDPHWFHPLES